TRGRSSARHAVCRIPAIVEAGAHFIAVGGGIKREHLETISPAHTPGPPLTFLHIGTQPRLLIFTTPVAAPLDGAVWSFLRQRFSSTRRILLTCRSTKTALRNSSHSPHEVRCPCSRKDRFLMSLGSKADILSVTPRGERNGTIRIGIGRGHQCAKYSNN